MSQVRLYLDEDSMRRSLVFALRARNVDVLTAAGANMINREDDDHLAAASAFGRTLFTHNTVDYCVLHQQWIQRKRTHSGIIVAPQQRYRRRGDATDHEAHPPTHCRRDAVPAGVHFRLGLVVENPMADRNDADSVQQALDERRFDVVYDNAYDWERGTTAAQVPGHRARLWRPRVALYFHVQRGGLRRRIPTCAIRR